MDRRQTPRDAEILARFSEIWERRGRDEAAVFESWLAASRSEVQDGEHLPESLRGGSPRRIPAGGDR